MTEATQLRPPPPPLPATRDALLAGYKLKRRRNINDQVEDIVVRLWENHERFMQLVSPIYESEASEGSIQANHYIAALIIQDIAKKDKIAQVDNANLHTVMLAMRVGLRRFGISVPERTDEAWERARLTTEALPPIPPSLEAGE